MESYLEHRFFMGSPAERRDNAWVNPPNTRSYMKTTKDARDWFNWRTEDTEKYRRETLQEWIDRIAPPCIEHLLDPDYGFFMNAASISVAVSSFDAYAGIYRDVFSRDDIPEETQTLFRKLNHMYVLRLRHDLYDLPCMIYKEKRRAPISPLYFNIFAGIPEILNPPSIDINGFYWIHPAIPKDTSKVNYFWNAVLSGKEIQRKDLSGSPFKSDSKNKPVEWQSATTKS